MKVSVIVPVFNSMSSLPSLVVALEAVLQDRAEEYEVILINDASTDDSWQTILDLQGHYEFIVGLNLARNFGQHNAILCGIRTARYEIIVTLDDDLQNPPSEIPKMLAKLEEGFDVVYGAPIKQQHQVWRNAASTMTKLILEKAMGTAVAKNISSFRVFRTCLREGFALHKGPFVSIDALLTWSTNKFASIEVVQNPRKIGSSNYNFWRLVAHAVNTIASYSTLPLQIASWNGFLCLSFGIVALIYVSVSYLMHPGQVPGFAFLACTILIFSGAQLFALGIIGEYLARVYARSMDYPSYLVKTISSSRQKQETTVESKEKLHR